MSMAPKQQCLLSLVGGQLEQVVEGTRRQARDTVRGSPDRPMFL
jgi:hypothetical protein